MINGRKVQLWYDMWTLKYTSTDRSFSIFQDNIDVGAIYSLHKALLYLSFTTACHQTIAEMVGYRYSYAELSSAAEDLKRGAGDGSHSIYNYYPHSVMINVYPKD